MRVPREADIRAPEFPRQLDWLNVAFLRMGKLVRHQATLIEFFDVARINSRRTVPYLSEWHARYADRGLRVIGVHCPGYSFGTDPELVAAEVRDLGIEYAVLLDPGFQVWQEYANKGWPGRYLFDVEGKLRWIHYGEGEYLDCELAIQDALAEIDAEVELPEPLEPLRPEDAPGVLLAAQTADIALPADRDRLELTGEWTAGEDHLEAASAGAAARPRSFDAGAAYAVLAGAGVDRPGLHPGDGSVTAAEPGLRLFGFQFTPKT